jgi:hypothetical protein
VLFFSSLPLGSISVSGVSNGCSIPCWYAK